MPRSFFPLVLLALPWALLAGEPDQNAICRHLDIKDLPGPTDFKQRVDKPAVITSAEELAKAFNDETVQAAIKKQVNFDKEKLVYFAWSGSGGDKLTFKIEGSKEKPEVVFLYHPGLTRDLRRHAHLFALAKNATLKVAPVRGRK